MDWDIERERERKRESERGGGERDRERERKNGERRKLERGSSWSIFFLGNKLSAEGNSWLQHVHSFSPHMGIFCYT